MNSRLRFDRQGHDCLVVDSPPLTLPETATDWRLACADLFVDFSRTRELSRSVYYASDRTVSRRCMPLILGYAKGMSGWP
jgi:hypothetical protein